MNTQVQQRANNTTLRFVPVDTRRFENNRIKRSRKRVPQVSRNAPLGAAKPSLSAPSFVMKAAATESTPPLSTTAVPSSVIVSPSIESGRPVHTLPALTAVTADTLHNGSILSPTAASTAAAIGSTPPLSSTAVSPSVIVSRSIESSIHFHTMPAVTADTLHKVSTPPPTAVLAVARDGASSPVPARCAVHNLVPFTSETGRDSNVSKTARLSESDTEPTPIDKSGCDYAAGGPNPVSDSFRDTEDMAEGLRFDTIAHNSPSFPGSPMVLDPILADWTTNSVLDTPGLLVESAHCLATQYEVGLTCLENGRVRQQQGSSAGTLTDMVPTTSSASPSVDSTEASRPRSTPSTGPPRKASASLQY
ncbi:hypothetical protein LTR17_022532 [Elasticomyces elasticus]|nr:hypothetical protein LTR17_022532 [Elasticomyces elasticus]